MDGSSTQSGSPTPSPGPDDEDHDLKEAIRLSMMDASTASGTPSPSPEPEMSKRGSKRKAEDVIGPQSVKRSQAALVDLTSSNSGPAPQPSVPSERVTCMSVTTYILQQC